MDHVVRAAPDRMTRPSIYNIEYQRAVNGNVGMQAGGGLPGAITNSGDEFAVFAGRMQRNRAAIAKHGKAGADHARYLHLQTLDGGIHTPGGATAGSFFAEHVPGLERVAQFQVDAAGGHGTDGWKAELEVGSKPVAAKGVTGPIQIVDHILPVRLHEVRQHEAVVQAVSPGNQFLAIWLTPELRDQRSHQELLGQAHARVRRHLKRAQFEETETGSGALRGIELVDAEFGAVGAAGYVSEQMTKEAIRHAF